MKFLPINNRRVHMVFVAMGFCLGLFALHLNFASAASIASSLEKGSRGNEVTLLQTYLSADDDLYPQKLVTGYFGPLTEAAVKGFQCREKIVCDGSYGYGVVGPRTRARLNQLMVGMTLTTPAGEVLGASTGNVGTSSDASAPIMSSDIVKVGSTFATIIWTTDEPAWSRVLYSASSSFSLLGALEAKDPSFDITSGVTIGNLEPNTQYYYVRESVDAANNASVSGVRSFVTSTLGSAAPGSVSTSTNTNTQTASSTAASSSLMGTTTESTSSLLTSTSTTSSLSGTTSSTTLSGSLAASTTATTSPSTTTTSY